MPTKNLLACLLLALAPLAAHANAGAEPKQVDWPFDGVFGKFDKPSVQRGFQVYKEVCSACHSLKRVPFRKLAEIGFSEAEVKSLAAGYTVHDGPNDAGEMFDRPGRPSDYLPPPYPNDNAARASNSGALPPDQSLLIKAREDGANYIYSILTGYGKTPPADLVLPPGAYYNPYFTGGVIKMPPPLSDNQVSYQDGTPASLDQEAKDVVNFLQWAAEPEMEQRKRMGIKVMLFLGVMTGFFYLAKKRIWGRLEH
jgi:ubiquinol-cytochrome c reductase cytochrome c1 subunit